MKLIKEDIKEDNFWRLFTFDGDVGTLIDQLDLEQLLIIIQDELDKLK